jgi:hypothetical protein
MIRYWRRASPEQRKLLYLPSLDFLTFVPGTVGLLWFLPLLHYGLRTDDYAVLLSSLALGHAVVFSFMGTNTIGRRLIGQAFDLNDRQSEADYFLGLTVANSIASCGTLLFIGVCCWWQHIAHDVLIIAALLTSTPRRKSELGSACLIR